MSMTQDGRGSGFYVIESGVFKGLYNAAHPTLIPDDYLYDMKNLRVTELGTLHSVPLPSGPIDWHAQSLNAITSIGSFGAYIGQTDTLSDSAGNTLISEVRIGEVPIIKHLGKSYALSSVSTGGLYRVDTGTKITAATVGFPASTVYSGLAVYEMRMFYGTGQTLRGSANGQDLEASTVVNGGRKVWGPWEGPNMDINMVFAAMPFISHLVPTQNALLIFGEEDVFSMNTFFGGKAVPIYHGPDVPHGVPGYSVVQFPYSDGQTVYYASEHGLFGFSSSPILLSPTLAFPSRILSFSVCEYDGRIWFLVCTQGHPAGFEVNYIYAINKRTGCWEKYDLQMTAKNGNIYDTPTALVGGINGEPTLMFGTSVGTLYDWIGATPTNTALPWSFTTKAFTPSFDIQHQPVKFRIDYRTQTAVGGATSPVVVTTYIDGVAEATTITFDMAEGTGGEFRHREFDIPTAKTANHVQFLVEGTGLAEISNVGYSLSMFAVGDTNP